MKSVSLFSYSIILNGSPLSPILPSRGLRQGDPLSPYLFVMCSGVFSFLLSRATSSGIISGVKVTSTAPIISHLFFADDSLLFGTVSDLECTSLLEVIHNYGQASGQQINFDKSSIYFSKNTFVGLQNNFCTKLGVKEVDDLGVYLGLPSCIGGMKYASFAYLKDRIWKCLKSWSNQFSSAAGKEILIKAFAQAIPTYVMSCFKVPIKLISELNGLFSRFWWGKVGGASGIYWESWMNLCTLKLVGGMGFRDFECFNLALLAKKCWRILKCPSSLVARVLKARYIKSCDFLHAELGMNPSFLWRSIWSARSILDNGLRWRIGYGSSVYAAVDK